MFCAVKRGEKEKMRNYIAFFVIIIFFIGVFAFNFIVVNNIEYELLNTAKKLENEIKEGKDFEKTYNSFMKTFKGKEVVLNMVINNSKYADIEKCTSEFETNMKFNNRQSLEINAKKLVFLIKDIIDEEKCEIHNIL